MKMKISTTVVSSQPRRLNATWSLETVDVVTSDADDLKELMRTVGLGELKLTINEAVIALHVMWRDGPLECAYPRYNVMRLIDNGLLKDMEIEDVEYKLGLITVAATDKMEQEFRLLENYRSL